ncbi:retrovirus-related pol polyprotein from transposon TNT 1-94 [Tanacetum coccineum]
MNEDKIKKDIEEIETINIKLDHRVSKLITKNVHLKQTYKQLYDSIKPTRVRSKEQCDALVNQVNQKFVEISDLNASIQEQVLVITNLKNELRKLKGKDLVDNVVTKNTIDPEMLKVVVEPIAPKLLNNRTTYSYYLRQTQEQAAILREVVEQGKSQNPLNNFLDSALAVNPKNKDKRVRLTETVTSSRNTNTKTTSSSNLVFNKPMLSSTGVKLIPSLMRILNFNVLSVMVACFLIIMILCILDFINDVNARVKSKSIKKSLKRKVWKPTGKVFTNIGYTWRPTGRTFTIVGNACPLTRITTTTEVPLKKPTALESDTPKPVVTLDYSRKPRKSKTNILVSKPQIIKSISANKKEPNKSWGSIVFDVPSSFLDECTSSKLFSSTVKFRNDHVAKILGYGDYQIENIMISKVYYVEGRGHNLFSVREFCDSNLEVAFVNTPASFASKTKSWLWHRRLSHLNFGAINHLARLGLFRGLPKLKFKKDHLCSAPMHVASIIGEKYILDIVDDYSRFTWVKCLRSKDEASDFIMKFLKMIQKVGISHETSVARSSQQNGVVERCNCTLIEDAHTMLIYAKAPLFLWAETVATACYTQNRSIIRLHHGKTPYELLHDKLPDLSFFYIFCALCYPTNNNENWGKLQLKADIGIFIGYAPTKKAFGIYNRRTRQIIKTIHVDFDELTAMASKHSSLEPALHEMTPATISSGLVPTLPPSTPFAPPSRTDWDLLFQPLFDELLNPPPSVNRLALEVIDPIAEVVAPEPTALTGSPSSTTVDQDAPSVNHKQHPKLNLLSFLMTLKMRITT